MDPIDEGSSGTILPWSTSIIRKKCKRQTFTLPLYEQRAIHAIAENITNTMHILKTPKLHHDFEYPHYYLMEKVDIEEPIWLGDSDIQMDYEKKFLRVLVREVQVFWQSMWNYGYAPWDFELYLQPDSRVMILDFDKFGKRLLSNPKDTEPCVRMPFEKNFQGFFDHICFPEGFTDGFPHTIMEHFHPSRISYMKIAA